MNDPEHRLQVACVNWFRYQYPKLKSNLFAVPNGGHRALSTAKRLKKEGVLSGVSDLIMLYPKKGFHGLLIEMKVKPNRPSKEQKEWLQLMTDTGYCTDVCYTIEQFMTVVNAYIGEKN